MKKLQLPPELGRRRVLEGVVVSDRMQKTVVVAVERKARHPIYKKTMRRTKHYKAHDESDECRAGDVVRIVEVRPLSRDKRWAVVNRVRRGEMAEVAPQVIGASLLGQQELRAAHGEARIRVEEAPVEPPTVEAPVEPQPAEASAEPELAEAPVEPPIAEAPVEPQPAEASVEPPTAEAPAEPRPAEASVEPPTAEAPAEPEPAERPSEEGGA